MTASRLSATAFGRWPLWAALPPILAATMTTGCSGTPELDLGAASKEVRKAVNRNFTCSLYLGDVGPRGIEYSESVARVVAILSNTGYLEQVIDPRKKIRSSIRLTAKGRASLQGEVVETEPPPYAGGPVVEKFQFPCVAKTFVKVVSALPGPQPGWTTVSFTWEYQSLSKDFIPFLRSAGKTFTGAAHFQWSEEGKTWKYISFEYEPKK